MKHSALKWIALILALCCLLPLVVACTGDKDTETKKPAESKKPTESEQQETTEPGDNGDDIDNNIPDGAVCSISDSENRNTYYFTLEEALRDNPDGAEITMMEDYSMTEEITLPKDSHYIIHYDLCKVELKLVNESNWVVCEEKMDRSYVSHFEDLLDEERNIFGFDQGLHKVVFWVFDPFDDPNTGLHFEAGRYIVMDKNVNDQYLDTEYEFTHTHGVEMYDIDYVASFGGGDGRRYYTLQEAIDNFPIALTGHSISLECDYDTPDVIKVSAASDLRIAYNYNVFRCGGFNMGATYDDCENPNGYCYYSRLSRLDQASGLEGTYVYIWSDYEDFRPGKYRIEKYNPTIHTETEVWGDDGLVYEGRMSQTGMYYITWIDEIDTFGSEWADIPFTYETEGQE